MVTLGGGVGKWEKATKGFQGPGNAPSLDLRAGYMGVSVAFIQLII